MTGPRVSPIVGDMRANRAKHSDMVERVARKSAATLEQWGVADSDRLDVTALVLAVRPYRRNGRMDLADAACDADLHHARVRSLVSKYGDALRIGYEGSAYSRSGSGAFGHAGTARSAYCPAELILR